jgi:hypothetical protein
VEGEEGEGAHVALNHSGEQGEEEPDRQVSDERGVEDVGVTSLAQVLMDAEEKEEPQSVVLCDISA